MSNRKSKSLSKTSGSTAVFWDQMRGENQTSFSEGVKPLKFSSKETANLTEAIGGWFSGRTEVDPIIETNLTVV
jgi:hypothetical protein